MDSKDSSKEMIPGLETLGLSFNSKTGQLGKRVINLTSILNEQGTPPATTGNSLFPSSQRKESTSTLIWDHLTTLSTGYLNNQISWHYNKKKKTAWIISSDKQKLDDFKKYLETLSEDINVEIRTTSDTKLPILMINDIDLEKLEKLTQATRVTETIRP